MFTPVLQNEWHSRLLLVLNSVSVEVRGNPLSMSISCVLACLHVAAARVGWRQSCARPPRAKKRGTSAPLSGSRPRLLLPSRSHSWLPPRGRFRFLDQALHGSTTVARTAVTRAQPRRIRHYSSPTPSIGLDEKKPSLADDAQ